MMRRKIKLNGVEIEVVRRPDSRAFHHRLSSFHGLEDALVYAVSHLQMDQRHGLPVSRPSPQPHDGGWTHAMPTL